MVRLAAFLLLFWGTTAFALLRGGRDERAAAAVVAVAFALSPLVAREVHSRFAGLEGSLLIVDVCMFAGLAIIALRSERFWPLWLTAMQGVVLLSHLSSLLPAEIGRLAYASAEKLWSYPQLILLLIATWRHRSAAPPADAASN